MCLPAAGAAVAGTAASTAGAASALSALSYASLAISALSTGLEFIGAQQQAAAQADYARKVVQASVKDFINRTAAEQQRIAQEQEAASRTIQESQTEALKKKATARVAAGEAGVAGLSVDALMADFERSEGAYREAVLRNLDYETLAAQDRMKAYRSEAQGRATSIPPIVKPSYLGLAIKGAGLAIDHLTREKERELHL